MIRGVFFDMDGTVTRPHIDWRELRRRVGVPEGTPIMAHVESLCGPERQRAEGMLLAAEMEAAELAELNPGAAELLSGLRQAGLKLALITNNHRQAMERVVTRFALSFDVLLSREDGPLKPAPDLLLLALERLGLQPGEACFVGDGHYDRLASQAAGIRYLHLAHDGQERPGEPTLLALRAAWQHLGRDPVSPPRAPAVGSASGSPPPA
ncbi:MAG: HAD-IA family hydrolase [Candidatus Latescibacterota bacterium]